ncbi:hypothetical protein [Natrinema longum]|uniref:DUF8060 domain-containing protein n=1 Tax=Natrinema longum TaxID=370324 RepID=A0A8A2U8D3_9EURY|nr:hypothetical protein [Natrinema longum]MBZ6494176.1 hypothetical protein [Natrinema longum]QSW84495.1 hypothetical protein J0X27_13700 [Natrinema longum]
MTDTPTRTQTETSIDEAEETSDRSDEVTETPQPPGSSSTTGFDGGSGTIRRYIAWGALAICSLLAVVALIRFYGSVTAAIDLWVDPKYQPLIHAAFNLTVLLTSLIGVSLLVRELTDSRR